MDTNNAQFTKDGKLQHVNPMLHKEIEQQSQTPTPKAHPLLYLLIQLIKFF